MSPFEEACRTEYRKAIRAAGPDGTSRKEAIDVVVALIRPRVSSGELAPDVDEAINRQCREQDHRDGTFTDAALQALMRGEATLGLDGDPALDVVVVLGAGARKVMRYITRTDLVDMDRERYRNLRAIQNSYDEWRHLFEAWFTELDRYPDVGSIHSAGVFPLPDQDVE